MENRILLDRADKRIITVDTQDVEPILEQNALDRTTQQRHDCARKVATVPNVILTQWLYEEHNRGNKIRMFSKEFYELVYRKLSDPDWAKLRTDGGDQFFLGYR